MAVVELPRDLCVFLNCPFDAEFERLFDTLVLAVVACGFIPRSALETNATSIPRMNRLCAALMGSRYSIHDLSRCKGEGELNLARFNMPLELGMAIQEQHQAASNGNAHDWHAIVTVGHTYQRFVSDLSGFDVGQYDGSPEGMLASVVAWLQTRPTAVAGPSARQIRNRLGEYLSLQELAKGEGLGTITWRRRIEIAQGLFI